MVDETLRVKTVVLIVEDDKFLSTLLSEKLQREGIFVVSAENGEEALIKMKADPQPQVILLDLLLPIVDGFEVLRRMREDQELKRIPVLVLSNLGQESDIKRAKDLGAVDYMVKAYFTPGEIVDKVRRIIREEYV
ncbi:MAG: response regulator [bacterium]|nr:response regulator [bacterium]